LAYSWEWDIVGSTGWVLNQIRSGQFHWFGIESDSIQPVRPVWYQIGFDPTSSIPNRALGRVEGRIDSASHPIWRFDIDPIRF
jgi:hypothetical protein